VHRRRSRTRTGSRANLGPARRNTKIRRRLLLIWERVRSEGRHSVLLFLRCAAILTSLLSVAAMMHSAAILTSWASSIALILSASDTPAAQPRRIIGGHIISAALGTGLAAISGHSMWMVAVSVPLAIVITHCLDVLHPPAIANSAIPFSISIPSSSFLLLATVGGFILGVVALLVRKSHAGRC
jgi:CBS-domain-containing membrane protein